MFLLPVIPSLALFKLWSKRTEVCTCQSPSLNSILLHEKIELGLFLIIDSTFNIGNTWKMILSSTLLNVSQNLTIFSIILGFPDNEGLGII